MKTSIQTHYSSSYHEQDKAVGTTVTTVHDDGRVEHTFYVPSTETRKATGDAWADKLFERGTDWDEEKFKLYRR